MANSITNNPITGWKDRSVETAPVSDHIHFKAHEDTESDVTSLRDYGNTGIFTNDVFDLGGSGHAYAAGFLNFSGDQDGVLDDADLRAFLRLDTLAGVGGMLLLAYLDIDAAPASSFGEIIYCGANSADPGGGYEIQLNNNGAVRLGYQPVGGSLQTLESVSGTAPYLKSVGFYFDCYSATPRGYGFADGVLDGSGTDLDGGAATLPTIKPTRMFAIGAKRTSDSLEGNKLNSNSDDARIADLRLIRFEYDAYGDGTVADVVAEYGNNPRELYLRTLAGK